MDGITQRPQSDIVYICCELTDIISNCEEWCFTNGHAKDSLTEFFNSMNEIDEIHWDAVGLRYWRPTEDFQDKQTRKQAEFLVRNHVPVNCISGIFVYTEEKRILIQQMLDRLSVKIPVSVNKEFYYY